MATRDDKVVTVSYPDGTTIVEHSDGTRITTYYCESSVPVEEDEDTGLIVLKIYFVMLNVMNSSNN